jgi:chromosome segregation protein
MGRDYPAPCVSIPSSSPASSPSPNSPPTSCCPGQLVGVVGPNGCGKSNIMDAVRWVLGESKASELRGESMQDVIFNGTTTRKPASRSSVELVFDNADHRAGGQWGQFTEIAVKRVLTRDGTSSYYINNQPVRRRDVQDVFLGTGLGPRAYAIIGQGTISRIIESKPEELRLFLEEAAGVSKYKERRRETENRLSDTRENLTRVEDILRELNANLEKLEKQAEVAQRYNTCRPTSRCAAPAVVPQAQPRRGRPGPHQGRGRKVRQRPGIAAWPTCAASRRPGNHPPGPLRRGRPGQPGPGPAVRSQRRSGPAGGRNPLCGGGPPARGAAPGQLKEQVAQWATRRDDALAELETLAAQGLEAEEKAAMLAAQVEEQATQPARPGRRPAPGPGRATEQRTSVARCSSRSRCWPPTSAILKSSRASSACAAKAQRRPQRAGRADEARLVNLQTQLARRRKPPRWPMRACTSCRTRCRCWTKTAAPASRCQHPGRPPGRPVCPHGGAQGLQEKVRTDGKLKPWLAKHGLDGLQGLWSRIHIEQGWENALEAALRERLNSLEVSAAGDGAAVRGRRAAGQAGVLQPAAGRVPEATGALPRLADLLRLNDAGQKALLADWLHGCYTAPALKTRWPARQAAARRSDLRAKRPRRHRPQRQLLRAGLRAGRPAGARPGNRKPGQAARRRR